MVNPRSLPFEVPLVPVRARWCLWTPVATGDCAPGMLSWDAANTAHFCGKGVWTLAKLTKYVLLSTTTPSSTSWPVIALLATETKADVFQPTTSTPPGCVKLWSALGHTPVWVKIPSRKTRPVAAGGSARTPGSGDGKTCGG